MPNLTVLAGIVTGFLVSIPFVVYRYRLIRRSILGSVAKSRTLRRSESVARGLSNRRYQKLAAMLGVLSLLMPWWFGIVTESYEASVGFVYLVGWLFGALVVYWPPVIGPSFQLALFLPAFGDESDCNLPLQSCDLITNSLIALGIILLVVFGVVLLAKNKGKVFGWNIAALLFAVPAVISAGPYWFAQGPITSNHTFFFVGQVLLIVGSALAYISRPHKNRSKS